MGLQPARRRERDPDLVPLAGSHPEPAKAGGSVRSVARLKGTLKGQPFRISVCIKQPSSAEPPVRTKWGSRRCLGSAARPVP